MSKIRVIIDTDPGVDDAIALWLALASPELDVLGVTVVAGNVPLEATLKNACKIVALSGRTDVPVFAGAPGPLVREQVYGKYAHIGAFSHELVPDTASVPPQDEHAVDFLVRTLRQAALDSDPVTLCVIGPMTNIALALGMHPDVARGIRQIVSMSCAFTALGHRVPWAEFNVYADPHAAEKVFSSGVPLVIMPLDMTFQALIGSTDIEYLCQHGGEPGKAIAALLAAFDRTDIKRFGRDGGPVHDATTIAWLLQPALFSCVAATVGVEVSGKTAGYTYADFYRKLDTTPNATVIQSINESGFFSLLKQRISHYGTHEGIHTP